MPEIDAVQLNFSAQNLLLLNVSLGFIMFGVALNLTTEDFARLVRNPKPALVGVASQFLLLPVLTFGLVWVLRPTPSIALGMILVAACPGGNISNFMSMNAQGNTALSVTLTAVSTVLAIVLTPINLSFWGGLYPPAASILTTVDVSFWRVFKTVTLILGFPIVLGMSVRHVAEDLAKRLCQGMQALSIAIFVIIVIFALRANFDYLIGYLGVVFDLVLLHNALALAAGYQLAYWAHLPVPDRQTLALETGIQNSGLGLILIFNFFDGLGGMAVVAGWWGVWHILSGLGLSFYWRSQKSPFFAPQWT
ncbi:symporter [Salinibacter sp. 10B]|uniref:bile acid:sodium symporter family protein n=1 Tax=Salinibacter sp. 10B TaxID=1923971 RepID=UPI000CF56575|nr:bile acid:sodium symporter family protein [Salinibacter sp. 10B]PQJ35138.1 symporter [Salinibacter sp. 10B]